MPLCSASLALIFPGVSGGPLWKEDAEQGGLLADPAELLLCIFYFSFIYVPYAPKKITAREAEYKGCSRPPTLLQLPPPQMGL